VLFPFDGDDFFFFFHCYRCSFISNIVFICPTFPFYLLLSSFILIHWPTVHIFVIYCYSDPDPCDYCSCVVVFVVVVWFNLFCWPDVNFHWYIIHLVCYYLICWPFVWWFAWYIDMCDQSQPNLISCYLCPFHSHLFVIWVLIHLLFLRYIWSFVCDTVMCVFPFICSFHLWWYILLWWSIYPMLIQCYLTLCYWPLVYIVVAPNWPFTVSLHLLFWPIVDIIVDLIFLPLIHCYLLFWHCYYLYTLSLFILLVLCHWLLCDHLLHWWPCYLYWWWPYCDITIDDDPWCCIVLLMTILVQLWHSTVVNLHYRYLYSINLNCCW